MKPLKPLSPMQEKIARLCGQGLSRTFIARELKISEATVRNHIEDAVNKLPAAAGQISPYKRLMLWAAVHYQEP